MKSAKEIKEGLEKEHGWNFSSEENMEMYYDLFLDVQKVVLRQPPTVSGCRQGDLCIICGEEIDSDYGSVCSDCDDSHLDD